MAKQTTDRYTRDLFDNKPGRPPKVGAMSAAQRARVYRQRHKFNMLVPSQDTDVKSAPKG
jgi:hypothetical protein